jgi:cytochrome c peroxidase
MKWLIHHLDIFSINLNRIPDYEGLFEIAYGGPVNMDSLSRALAAYQYSLVSGNSSFDKWYYGGESKGYYQIG